MTCVLTGDIGDAIAFLPVLRQLGGGDIVFSQGRNPRPFNKGAGLLIGLFEAQPYVHSAIWSQIPGVVDYNMDKFRSHYKPNRTLSESQADYIGMKDLDMRPWLEAPPSPISLGKIVIARSKRYTNPSFPWRKVLMHFRNKLLFVGLDDERAQLERIVGWRIPHHKVADFYALASIIRGSDFFIGNQSSPGWLAMGMGHPMVQETSPKNNKDSMVHRFNASFVMDGAFPFENLPHQREYHHAYDI